MMAGTEEDAVGYNFLQEARFLSFMLGNRE